MKREYEKPEVDVIELVTEAITGETGDADLGLEDISNPLWT